MENIELLLTVLSCVFGLILGSFFNVLIYRVPREESVVWPPSHCTSCKRTIPWYENIPVFSYIALWGKCSGCKSKISSRYPLIELVTGSCMLFLWYYYILPFLTGCPAWYEYCVLVIEVLALLILIPIAIIDIEHYIIPDSITIGGTIIGFAVSFIPGSLSPLSSLLGIVAGGGSLLIIGIIGSRIAKKDAMGGGDIKLMAFLGAVFGWKIALYTIMFGALFGTLFGLPLLLFRLIPKDHKIPFGPFLALGVWVAVFAGDFIMNSYFDFIERFML